MEIYSRGLCAMSICVDADTDRSEIERIANTMNPTGISSHWKISTDNFNSGEKNPHPCEAADGKLHYLLTC